MKISVDKKFVAGYQMEQVKADMKWFKECFTDGDLIREFTDQTGEEVGWNCGVIYCRVEAFNGGSDFNFGTCFHVEVMFYEGLDIVKVNFYCDTALRVSKTTMFGDKMYNVKRFRAE